VEAAMTITVTWGMAVSPLVLSDSSGLFLFSQEISYYCFSFLICTNHWQAPSFWNSEPWRWLALGSEVQNPSLPGFGLFKLQKLSNTSETWAFQASGYSVFSTSQAVACHSQSGM